MDAPLLRRRLTARKAIGETVAKIVGKLAPPPSVKAGPVAWFCLMVVAVRRGRRGWRWLVS